MNLNFRKTALLVGVCSAFGLGYTPQLFAASVDAIEAVQQTRKITGTITDAMGPVIGANVLEKGTTNGVITDIDGNFTLNVQPGATIVVSFIGYQTQEIVVGNQTNFRIQLKEDAELLDEVVVVGYGVQKKKLVTGATVEVKGEDIAKLNTTQALGALQSQSPGVNIQAVSGQPGDGFKINIRGAGTNGNTAPIYVIDGVAGGDINALNPADIERIDVLKDAASCAIYGSSGANGVILITTKQGKVGKVSVTYDGNIGWANIYKMPDMLNAKEYMAVMDQVAFNNGSQPYDWSKYVDADVLASYQNGTNPGTNWVEELRNKNAVVTNHALNITGGSEFSKFSTGLGYQYQDGAFGGPVKSDFRRFTFRINSEHVVYRKGDMDVVKFGENVYYQHKQNQGVQLGTQYANDLSNALRAIPLIPVYNENGDYFMYNDLKNFGTSANGILDYTAYASNPVAHMVYNQAGNNKNKNFNLNTSAYLEIQPIKNLVYKGQVSYKQWSSSWRSYLPVYQINNQGDSRDKDQTVNNVSLGWNWSLTNTLSYQLNIAQHHIDVLAGTEYSKSRPTYGESVNATGYNSAFGDFAHAYLHNTERKATATVDGYPSDYGSKMSYFGRLNYDFKETYMLSAIIRADGSSKFAKDNQWGYFPSFSAGWVVSNEAFMENTSSWLSFLKLRAGWGQNGNDNIPNSNWRAGYEFGDYGLYTFGSDKNGGTTGAYPNRLANPDLTWETSEQTNIGLDARFLDNRLSFTLDWYNKMTKDLLVEVGINAASGFSKQYQNAGTVKNTGLEVSMGWRDQVGKDFKYGINLNMAYNKNEVTKVNNANHFIEGGNDLLAQSTGRFVRMEEGHPIGYFYGYKTDGVIQNLEDLQAYLAQNCNGDAANSKQGQGIKPGDLKFVDVDGNGVINDYDKTDLGNPHPDVTTGLTLSAEYKGIDISVTAYGAFGAQVARSWRKFSDGQYENYTTEVYDYWHGEGTSNRFPMLAPGNAGQNFQAISDIYIDDASYVRIQNLTIGYDFKRLWKTCPFQQLRVYAAAQNLFTFTGYKGMDPENGMALNDKEAWVTGVDVGNYPQPRTYMLGVNVKF
ncbi:TonB-dependent receptor [Bacteroides sp. GD17]|jgi:TonB-linked SusC/RagA family outer membrane protein|uniref:SusC/RagA family TonB-linked outer membrane protein n=1 Tax=Bacteroides sp. GD17 TaxID=3139826 RepID=UPI00313B7C00